jgi:hypothetical protein
MAVSRKSNRSWITFSKRKLRRVLQNLNRSFGVCNAAFGRLKVPGKNI